MYKQRRVLAVVPARGGSKGVPLKNIRPVNGVPLVARVGHLVQSIDLIDRSIVSTDHPEIAKVASESGLAAPFFRPEELSGDRIGDIPVLQHALQAMETLDKHTYDIVLMLQPTSPMRTDEHIRRAITRLVDEELDAIWSVSTSDVKFHPLKQLKLNDGKLNYYDPRGAEVIARQQLEPLYFRNGLVYAMTRACLLNGTLMGQKTGALVVDEPLVNIDTFEDMARCEQYFREKERS